MRVRWTLVNALWLSLALLGSLFSAPTGTWLGRERAEASRADQAGKAHVQVDQPSPAGPLLGEIEIGGWAADPTSAEGTGVDAVQVYLDGMPPDEGTYLGKAEYGLDRPDVAAMLGEQFVASGYRFTWRVAAPPGEHELLVLARDRDGQWVAARRPIVVDPRAPRYPELEPPDDDDDPVNQWSAARVLAQVRIAADSLTSMREHRTGHVYTPEGREVNLYLYNLEFQAPDRSYQRSSVTTPDDSAEQRIITIGKTSWFWRGEDRWEETTNRTAFAFPGERFHFRGIWGARRLPDDELNGRLYRLVDFSQAGNEWVGAPGWSYRVRLWIDAETSLPSRLEKAALTNQVVTDTVVTLHYREETDFFGYNSPVSIEPPS
jgi:hypothetical protein